MNNYYKKTLFSATLFCAALGTTPHTACAESLYATLFLSQKSANYWIQDTSNWAWQPGQVCGITDDPDQLVSLSNHIEHIPQKNAYVFAFNLQIESDALIDGSTPTLELRLGLSDNEVLSLNCYHDEHAQTFCLLTHTINGAVDYKHITFKNVQLTKKTQIILGIEESSITLLLANQGQTNSPEPVTLVGFKDSIWTQPNINVINVYLTGYNTLENQYSGGFCLNQISYGAF